METRIHDGHVIEYNERRMVLSVRDEKLDKNVDVHWTSYWGEVPSLIPQPNEAVELVYNGTEACPHLLAARPKRGVL